MKILKNYILKEWLLVFLLSLLVISFVLVIGNIIKFVELTVAKGVNIREVGKLFILLLPSLLVFSLPISALTATLLCFGRLASDNEIIALRSSGISLYTIVMDLGLIGIMISLLSLYFNDSLIPKAHFLMRKTVYNIGIKNPTAYLEEKTFIKAFQDQIIFIYKIKGNNLEDVRIYQPQTDKPTRTIISEKGQFIPLLEKNAIKLELINGMADEPSFDNPNQFFKLNFKTYHLNLYLKGEKEINNLGKKIQDMTISEIKNEIEQFKFLGIDTRPLQVGLHEKFSLAFSSLAFILLGMPLAIRVRRRERSLGFGLSLIVCFLYYLVMAFGESLALRNIISPFWGMWFANFLLLFIGIFLIFKVIEA